MTVILLQWRGVTLGAAGLELCAAELLAASHSFLVPYWHYSPQSRRAVLCTSGVGTWRRKRHDRDKHRDRAVVSVQWAELPLQVLRWRPGLHALW